MTIRGKEIGGWLAGIAGTLVAALAGSAVLAGIGHEKHIGQIDVRVTHIERWRERHQDEATDGFAVLNEHGRDIATIRASLAAMTSQNGAIADALIKMSDELTRLRVEVAALNRRAMIGPVFEWEASGGQDW